MEKQWSCGCIEVDGQLVQECSQQPSPTVVLAHQTYRYSPICYRKREPEVTQPEAVTEPTADTDNPVVTPEVTDGVQE